MLKDSAVILLDSVDIDRSRQYDLAIRLLQKKLGGPAIKATLYKEYQTAPSASLGNYAWMARMGLVTELDTFWHEATLVYHYPALDTLNDFIPLRPKPRNAIDTLKAWWQTEWHQTLNKARVAHDQTSSIVFRRLAPAGGWHSIWTNDTDQVIFTGPTLYHSQSSVQNPSLRFFRKGALGFFQKIGLFDHLNPAQRQFTRETVLASDADNLGELLCLLPFSGFPLYAEADSWKLPSTNFCRAVSRLSQGWFSPANFEEITDEIPGESHLHRVKFSFQANGRRYDTTYKVYADWMSPDFIPLVQRALRDANSPLQLYPMTEYRSIVGYCLLTEAQYKAIKALEPAIDQVRTQQQNEALLKDIFKGEFLPVKQ